MAFESTKLSAGIGGGMTLQFFTYTTDIDAKADMDVAYWTREDGVTLPESLMKDGAFIFYTSTSLGNDLAEMGIRWFDPKDTNPAVTGGNL